MLPNLKLLMALSSDLPSYSKYLGKIQLSAFIDLIYNRVYIHIYPRADEGFAIISSCACNAYTSINQATSNNSGPNKRSHFTIISSILLFGSLLFLSLFLCLFLCLVEMGAMCAEREYCGTCPLAIAIS